MVFIVVFIMVVVTVLIIISQSKNKENFKSKSEVPFKLMFEDVIMIDTSKPYTEYFVRDQLEKYYDAQLIIPKDKKMTMQVCQDAQCSNPTAFEIIQKNGTFTFPRSQIEMSPYVQLQEAFDPYYLPLPVTIYIQTHIQAGKVYTVKDLFSSALQNNDIRVTFRTTDAHRSGYDLYFCQNDKCRLDTWHLVDYDYNFSRAYSTVRITKKSTKAA
jgi:hypothetical protein